MDNKPVEQTATSEGYTYKIARAGEGWKATVQAEGGKATTLVDGTFAKAYRRLRAAQPSEVARPDRPAYGWAVGMSTPRRSHGTDTGGGRLWWNRRCR